MSLRWLGLLAATLVATAPALASPDLPAWLAGTWQTGEGGGTVREHWEAPAGGFMVGLNLSIRSESARFEFLRIAPDAEGRLAYHASPGGRHPPTVFVLERSDARSVVFANPAHDFPRRIGYALQEDGGLLAWIEGPDGDDARRTEWRFRRASASP